ncbi:Translocon-associated protein subunit beta [Linum grandiflorum]
MAIPVLNSLVSVLLILLFVSSTTLASTDVPFIVAHKKATLNRLKSGAERVSVSIDIYNQGSSTAYDVSLVDDHWPQDLFDVVSGNVSQSWERLDSGGLLSHSFELEGKVKGVFYSAPAVIKFRIPTKAALQEAFSTPIMPLDILADRPTENKLDLVCDYNIEVIGEVRIIDISNFHSGSVCVPREHSIQIEWSEREQEEALNSSKGCSFGCSFGG